MAITHAQEMPKYMQKGSSGLAVTLLQVFLCGYGRGREFVFDEEYGEVTAKAVRGFQLDNKLEPDGNFGPATREKAREKYHFDFEAAYKASSGGTSDFVQPDGEILVF